MNDLKNFLEKFLEIIDYPDNKEEFVNKISTTIYMETIQELLDSLPEEKQLLVKQQVSQAITVEALNEIINNNFEKQVFEAALKTNSEKIFTEYLETIDPVLTEEQENKLSEYFSSVPQQPAA